MATCRHLDEVLAEVDTRVNHVPQEPPEWSYMVEEVSGHLLRPRTLLRISQTYTPPLLELVEREPERYRYMPRDRG